MNLTPTTESHTITLEGRSVFYTARGPEDAEYAYVGINGLMRSIGTTVAARSARRRASLSGSR